jgi:predicted RNA polymerase sigma factor
MSVEASARAADVAVAEIFRREAGPLTASVTRVLDDFGIAEEIVADTILLALERWRRDRVPRNPGAWLMLAARRRALDRLRRDRRYTEKLETLAATRPAIADRGDDRLRMMFLCCHPAIAIPARVALTLQAVLGFTTAEIAAAFLAADAAVAQRLSRARRKIREARIRDRTPPVDDVPNRLEGIRAVLYLMFNEGYLSSSSAATWRRDLAADAAWLTGQLVDSLPTEPESLGLLALMRVHLARARSRLSGVDELVLLDVQDRSLWDLELIGEADDLLTRAAAFRNVGPYQVQAAIALCHATAPTWQATDWVQILVLYDRLTEMTPSPIVRLNRAIAVRAVLGPDKALSEVEAVSRELPRYHLVHATRARLLRDLGRYDEARSADRTALSLTSNPGERSLLRRRLFD